MNEREALLAAIKASPACNTARLVYADWLEENAECDRDRATAEFIRLCAKHAHTKPAKGKTQKVSDVLHPEVGRWLDWVNADCSQKTVEGIKCPGHHYWAIHLCPTLCAWLDAVNDEAKRPGTSINDLPRKPRILSDRKGRWYKFTYINRLRLPTIVEVEFWRGFVRRVIARDWKMMDKFLPRLLVDQPLCEPEIHNSIRTGWRLAHMEIPRSCYDWSAVYGQSLGPAEPYLKTATGEYQPDSTHIIAGLHAPRYEWHDIRLAERARWACCIALRKAAEDVIAGRRAEGSPTIAGEG